MADPIPYDTFAQVEIRVGTVTSVEEFPEARKPAYKLTVDFGDEIGTRRSSAQVTKHYQPDELVGKQVVAVLNLGNKRIGPFTSECLVTGFEDENGDVVLTSVERQVPNGSRLF